MAETVHVDDKKTVIYVNVTEDGVNLDTNLDSFSDRQINWKSPTGPLTNIPGPVPTEVDPKDGVKKLKLVTGPLDDFEISETGEFKAEVFLADGAGSEHTSTTVVLFTALAKLA